MFSAYSKAQGSVNFSVINEQIASCALLGHVGFLSIDSKSSACVDNECLRTIANGTTETVLERSHIFSFMIQANSNSTVNQTRITIGQTCRGKLQAFFDTLKALLHSCFRISFKPIFFRKETLDKCYSVFFLWQANSSFWRQALLNSLCSKNKFNLRENAWGRTV